ncbi:MAG: Ig-like domain-containing protein, partial [Acidimicrobiales bacterium]
MTNGSTMQVTNTTINATGGDIQVEGTLLTPNPLVIAGGTLSGTGTITGSISNTDTTFPGLSGAAGILTLNGSGAGNFTQGGTGTYFVQIGGTAAGRQYSQLNALGSATLDGALKVILVNGFAPALGNSFTIMNASSRVGQFATTNLPALATGLSWNVTYNPTSVVLTVVTTTATLTSITVTPNPTSVAAGNTVQFTATGHFSDSTTQNLTNTVVWSSSDTATATISNTAGTNGLATGVKAGGPVTIAATSGTISGNAALTVTAATLTSITVTPNPASVAAGGTVQFTATGHFSDSTTQNLTNTVVWSSSDTLTATISNTAGTNGLATGVKAGGPVTITATSGAISGNAPLTVTPAAASADLALTETAAPNPVLLGGSNITYTFTATNNGPSPATSVVLTETLPAGVTFVVAIPPPGFACNTQALPALSCPVGNLANGTSANVTVVVKPTAAGTVT